MSPTTHVSGTVTGAVEIRFTESGLTICRFRLTDVPRQWDSATREWRDGAPILYVCTAWGDLARNATESLVDGSSVLIRGRVSGVKDDAIRLSVDDLGLSLGNRIAYTEAGLPGPQAAAPVSPPAMPQPAEQVARAHTRQPGSPPGWWEDQRSSGWSDPGTSPATDASPARAGT
ncbi:single-stranded DNA-binding protein [Streptomyces sp. NPDC048489]|uniref:single-stranded DNA-binding protein n=1 Tax=Streptomyces sp. NPDC048489 TaxID=3154504 RepID=UPI003447A220